MQFNSQTLKRKFDLQDAVDESIFDCKRHNHAIYGTYMSSSPSVSPLASTPSNEADMEIDSPLFTQPSATSSFNPSTNQFHHQQTELPANMRIGYLTRTETTPTASSHKRSNEKIIRLAGLGGHMV